MNRTNTVWDKKKTKKRPGIKIRSTNQATVYGLSEEEIAFFRSNGYLVVRGRFSEEECDALVKQVELHASEDFAAVLNPDREEVLGQDGPVESRKYARATARLFRNLLKDPRLVSVVEALQGEEVVGLMTQVLFKKAGTPYASQAWTPHQDNSYPQSPNGRYITSNLFMGDADRENGSIYIFPGSHQEGLLPFKPAVSWREALGTNPGNTVKVPRKYKKVDLEFRKGDFLVLHCHTIHGSYPNESKTRSRPMCSCNYITQGEPFIPGKSAKRMVIPLH